VRGARRRGRPAELVRRHRAQRMHHAGAAAAAAVALEWRALARVGEMRW